MHKYQNIKDAVEELLKINRADFQNCCTDKSQMWEMNSSNKEWRIKAKNYEIAKYLALTLGLDS